MDESTYELLSHISAGDEQAFEVLFKQYRNKVYAYLLRITKFPEISEEITMDIFLKLWVRRDLLVNIRDPDAFLYKVAYNKALDFFRTTARHVRLQEAYTEHFIRLQETGQTSPMHEENLELLKKVVNGFPPRRKLIYRLSREENMTYEQIADHLNLSPKTVKNTMSSALKEIRERLNQRKDIADVILWLFVLNKW